MDIVKSYSRRSFVIIVAVIAVFLAGAGLAFYFNVHSSLAGILTLADIDTAAPEIGQAIAQMTQKQNELTGVVFGGLAIALFVIAVLIWMTLRLSLIGLVGQAGGVRPAVAASGPVPGTTGKRERQNHDRRMFLHLLSVLQREGRLLDFFAEDLSLYEDEQIGAAVRTIQEDCKTSMNKYLALKPIMEQPEGETVTVEADFDPNAVKLTGNVAGDPPFTGILRHKGWKATRTELPELSETRDSGIISPAEVEIE